MTGLPFIPGVGVGDVASPLAGLEKPVDLYLFTGDRCDPCLRLEQFARELAAFSSNLRVHPGLPPGSHRAIQFEVDKHPSVLIHGARPYRLIYAGVPAGYELGALVDLLLDASTGGPKVQHATRNRLQQLAAPVHIRIFVTPACTHCPTITRNAGKLAILSSQIAVEVIDAFEFPQIAEAKGIGAVPFTILNDRITLMEAVGEAQLVYAVMEAAV